MEAKEKAIREAYGEHWESLKNYHEGNGYLNLDPEFDYSEMGIEKDYRGIFRHKSLSGIETNNGWIRIESDKDNPIEGGCYWCLCYEEVKIVSYSCKLNTWLSSGVTHYQPIIKPLKPIY